MFGQVNIFGQGWSSPKWGILLIVQYSKLQFSGSSTVVEHSTHQPKVEGSSPVATAGIGREKMVKQIVNYK